MYYEVFDDLVYAYENNQLLTAISLVNKSYLDSFFDLRSLVNRTYPQEQEMSRLVRNSNPFLFYQKLILGVSKSTFLGFNVFDLSEGFFTEAGRIKVQDKNLELHLGDPCLFFTSDSLSYETSQFQRWEDEVFKIQDSLNSLLNVHITREGFRANLYRTLEIMYAMRSSSNKRRTSWTVFLHELIIHRKKFTADELASNFGFTFKSFKNLFLLNDPKFPTQDHLEYSHYKSLGIISTEAMAKTVNLGDQRNPLKSFSSLNKSLLGKMPLCHFFLNEHMFVYKEEFDLNAYYDIFVKSWGQNNLKISYRENETNIEKTLPFAEFGQALRQMKYSLVQGFYSEETDTYYSAEPKMLKDLSRA